MIKPPIQVVNQIETETALLFKDHPEFLWYAPQEYHIELFSWPQVEEDLFEPLQKKIEELMFDKRTFMLFGLEYVIRIGTRIDINLDFQNEKKYQEIIESLYSFFNPEGKPELTPHIALARYKVPSKQQYSHIKNQLAKLKTSTEMHVQNLTLVKATDFGKGIRRHEKLFEIPLAE